MNREDCLGRQGEDMKWIFVLVVMLAAVPAPAQEVILGVLQPGDFAVTIDTNTFFWGTLPEAKFIPEGWGGAAGTTDTFEFEILQPSFPPHVWIDYHRGGTIMARETIFGLVQDAWYDLPRFDKAPTRVKFLRSPGITEGRQTAAQSLQLAASPNPFRSSIRISLGHLSTETLERFSLCIYDPSGRMVRSLSAPRSLTPGPYFLSWDGRDAAGREVAAGVYVCRVRADALVSVLRVVKLD
jgi:hypothetical protein